MLCRRGTRTALCVTESCALPGKAGGEGAVRYANLERRCEGGAEAEAGGTAEAVGDDEGGGEAGLWRLPRQAAAAAAAATAAAASVTGVALWGPGCCCEGTIALAIGRQST